MTDFKLRISSVHKGRASMQCGKTTDAAGEYVEDILNKDALPMYFAYKYKVILTDFLIKAQEEAKKHTNKYIRYVIPTHPGHGRNLKRIDEMLTGPGHLYRSNGIPYDTSVGLAGLSNQYYLRKLTNGLHMAKDTEIIAYMDEYDDSEIGFKVRRIEKKKNGIKSEVAFHRQFNTNMYLFDTVKLISATNLAAAISDTPRYDEIKVIPPKEGYNNSIIHFKIADTDLRALKNGQLSPRIEEFHNMLKHNLMVNISNLNPVHERIAKAFPFPGTYLVNQDTGDFDFNSINHGKNVVIGGRLFSRGASFPRLDGLILHKSSSCDMTNLLQAVGRLFGYKNYPLFVACTQKQWDVLEASFELEARVSDVGLLELGVYERHRAVSSLKIDKNIIVLGDNNNGWKTILSKTGRGQKLVRYKI